MDYSYRNSRHRRRRRRQYRRFIAMIVVALTAGTLFAGYGFINLITKKNSAPDSQQQVALHPEASTTSSGLNSTIQVQSVSDSNPQGEEGKGAENDSTVQAKERKKKKSKKDAKKELVTFSKEKAEKYFKNTAFIGDSRTQGLQINAGITTPKFFAGRGLNVKNALTDKVVQGKDKKMYTVVESLKGKKYKKIYISFGINELGWTYPDVFIKRYKELIAEIRKEQEEAEIVVYGILPVTKKKNDGDKIFNMKNVKKFNKLIKAMAKEIEVTYVDLSPSVKNKKGFLPDDVTPDGIHMNREYCRRILAYIVNKEI